MMKQLAEPSTLMNTSAKARIDRAGIKNNGGIGDGFTLNEGVGSGAHGSGTTRNAGGRVTDGDLKVQQTGEAGHTSDKRALRGVLERLIALGNDEDGVFRNIIMFL